MKIQAPCGEIRVYVVKATIADTDQEECWAVYHDDKNEILVLATQPDAMKMSLLHELMHVCFTGHSDDIRKKVLGAVGEEAQGKREEGIVSFLEPFLYDLLARNGLLKIPRPPKMD